MLGVYGLLGSGRTELARALSGADGAHGRRAARSAGRPAAAALVVARRPARDRARPRGSNRSRDSFRILSVRENVTLSGAGDYPLGIVRRADETRRTLGAVARGSRSVRPPTESAVSTLSGGNQQKVVFGRWLVAGVRVLILDDPTVGVDVGAKEEIYRIVADLTRDGTAVVFLSSELLEVLGLADRMLVLRDLRVAGELAGDAMNEANALALALGEAA